MSSPIEYAYNNRSNHLAELFEFLRIPSVSTQPGHKEDTARAATWLTESMKRIGLENVHTFATDRHPLVYADWLHAGPEAPTVLVYGHYDVQPPEPLELWDSPPFAPVIRDDYVYARGSSDDKGQVYIHIKAAEAYLKANGRLPVNLKFIIEGEEEIGSEGLHKFIPQHRDLLAADSALVSDTAMLGRGKPALVYGLRGNCPILVDITGPGRDLHSGTYGGGINNLDLIRVKAELPRDFAFYKRGIRYNPVALIQTPAHALLQASQVSLIHRLRIAQIGEIVYRIDHLAAHTRRHDIIETVGHVRARKHHPIRNRYDLPHSAIHAVRQERVVVNPALDAQIGQLRIAHAKIKTVAAYIRRLRCKNPLRQLECIVPDSAHLIATGLQLQRDFHVFPRSSATIAFISRSIRSRIWRLCSFVFAVAVR